MSDPFRSRTMIVPTKDDKVRAAIYVRKSSDPKVSAPSVGEQEQDSRELCERNDWQVVAVYRDRSATAHGDDRHRPDYNRLVEDVASGGFDVVVSFHSERIWRENVDQGLFLAIGRAGGLQAVATVIGGMYWVDDPDDEFRLTIETAGSRLYAARTSMNAKRRQRHKAAAGEWKGGKRPYGYEVERDASGKPTGSGLLVPVAEEIAVIREAARRVLTGETCRAVAIDLNRRGIKTAQGNEWRSGTLAALLTNPTIAGLRTHHGANPVRATWADHAAIDEVTHEQLVAIFAARRRGPRDSAVRKHLLTGLLRCGRCGARVGTTKHKGETLYRCQPKGNGGCGGSSVKARLADEAVRDKVIAYLDSPEFRLEVRRAAQRARGEQRDLVEVAERLRTDRARLTVLRDEYADGLHAKADYFAMKARVEDRVATAARRLKEVRATSKLPALGPISLVEWEEQMTLEEKRTLLVAIAERFDVHPAKVRSRFDPERIRETWRFSD